MFLIDELLRGTIAVNVYIVRCVECSEDNISLHVQYRSWTFILSLVTQFVDSPRTNATCTPKIYDAKGV